ncbi:hypothetical protein G4B88_025481 [Cannabis sativa]|uniref:Uncharacterized protein n=1 Tax=Cannabis sativa TaxID=3483 RepID=A0A7J6FEU7_CANSA|nr:hypothetical protein G4B88_025481 [Cannabis sativa]
MIDSFSFVQSLKVVVDLAIQSRLWFTVAEFVDLVIRMPTALGSWSKVAGFVDLNIRTPACVVYAYTMDNEHKKVVKLIEKLQVAEDHAVPAEDQVTTLKEKIGSLKIKVLKEQVTTLENQAHLDVTFYNGLCFDAIYKVWSANGGAKSFSLSGFPHTGAEVC